MPVKSKSQARALFAKGRGDLVKRWMSEYGQKSLKSLPDHASGKLAQKRMSRGRS